jgi:hypothetical protein
MADKDFPLRVVRLQEGHKGPATAAPKMPTTGTPISAVPEPPKR